jgi:2-keto-4-pentenoate hydratase/2-oxohepta-3-ene-1,7-dioic acid hydratase in catechol pathway
MRLLRVGASGAERPVVQSDGATHDLTPLTADVDGAFLVGGGVAATRAALDAGLLPVVDLTGLRIGPPIARPGKIVCIGLNYSDHAAETGAQTPPEPVIFMKAPNTIVGPYDEVLVPRRSTCTDWEVELGVVIGARASYLDSPADAAAVVAGYVLSHDVSEREFQLHRGGTWDKGKSCDTFNPLGPWLVPADDVPDAGNLGLRLSVNGTPRQNGTTANMIFGVEEVVHYVSQFMVLEPGDLINTGTPAGVALGQPEPKPYLRAGDVVELEIDHLGRQRQTLGQA